MSSLDVFVFNSLSLPTTSTGFTKTKSTVLDSHDGSASPARKTPRLDVDSDTASASRKPATSRYTGPITIQINGGHAERPNNSRERYHSGLVGQAILDTLTRRRTKLDTSFESVYNSCRFVCMSDGGGGLYDRLKKELEQSVARSASELADSPSNGMQWIGLLVEVCGWFETQVALLKSLLSSLNHFYISKNKDVADIKNLAYSIFIRGIFENSIIAQNMQAAVVEWLNFERGMRLAHEDQQSISALVGHLCTHGQFSSFEELYINTTRSYYEAESKDLAKSMKNDCKGFLKHVNERIDEEIARAKAVLPPGSWGVVQETTEEALLIGRLEWLAKETLGSYLEAKEWKTLENMYRLYTRVDGKKIFGDALKTYVQASVQKIVKDPTLDDGMVRRLLEFKANIDEAISTAFLDLKVEPIPAVTSRSRASVASTSAPPVKQPNQDFIYTVGDAFALGFKARRNKPAEMLAKFLDKTMRKGQGTMSDASYEALLDSVLRLYRYTDDKDVFRTFYQRQLAKRLLLEKSASKDFEQAMLKKLQDEYDPDFPSGKEMFKDMDLSRELTREYRSKLPEDSEGHKLSVMVLQRSVWPFTVQPTTVDLPLKMQDELNAYTEFYKQKHAAHVLHWNHSLGTVTMLARFKPGTKELSLSLYQAVVLLLFNQNVQISFTDIAAQTRIDDDELRRTLQSLACGKKKVLKKNPPGKDVDDRDIFRFNNDFEDPRAKVHINSIQAKVTAEESKRTQANIEGDRLYYLEAAIVRVMKARKEMTYEHLKTAVIEAVKSHFIPQVDVIKKRIDHLVESEYLERSKTDKNTFLYVA